MKYILNTHCSVCNIHAGGLNYCTLKHCKYGQHHKKEVLSVTVLKSHYIIISLFVWSGKAPTGPEQQQSTGVQDQNQQVKAEQEAVEPRAEGQPFSLS